MKIKLECVALYSDNFLVDIELPEDIKFYEYFRHNDKQRFYVTIYKNSDDLFHYINKEICGRSNRYIFGDYMILKLRQCHPVNEDLPLMSLYDLNVLFDEHIKGYYIKSERPSISKTLEKNKNNKFEIIKDGKTFELGIDWLERTYLAINPCYYTEFIAKPLGFVDKTGEVLSMMFGLIRMRSPLSDDYHSHCYEVDIKGINILEEDTFNKHKITISNSEEIGKEYQEEISKLINMDNFNHIDYRLS